MVMGDFDNDGTPDVAVLGQVFVSGTAAGAVEVHFGDGNGGFRSGVATFTVNTSNSNFPGMAAADLDGDGQSELIFAAGYSVLIYDWDGSAFAQSKSIDLTNTEAGGIDATKIAVGNLTTAPDGGTSTPGSQDIVVSDDFGSVGVVWIPNDGAGNFGTPTAHAAGGCGYYAKPVVADVDGDGLDDVVLCHTPTVGVLINKGDGTLDAESTYGNSSLSNFQPQSVAVADVDGDGRPDLVVTGYIHDSLTFHDTYHLSVNRNNGDGTFADGQDFGYTLNGGNRIDALTIAAADLNGDGQPESVVTPAMDPGGTGFTGFVITQWASTSGTLTATQTKFPTNDGIEYQSLTLGYAKNDGSFATFNNDSQTDVLIGTSADIFGSNNTTHSQFALFENTTPTIPKGNKLDFTKTQFDVAEGDELDVTVVRGSDSTGKVTEYFSTFTPSGTAVLDGYQAKGQQADYLITDPAYGLSQAQPVVFQDGEFTKNIHIKIYSGKGSEPDKTIILTLQQPMGDAYIDPNDTKTVATITVHDSIPTQLHTPGGLIVKPTATLPVPVTLAKAGVKVAGVTGADWTFSTSQLLPPDAKNPSIKVQFSPNGGTNWIDTTITLTQGKGSAWSAVKRHPLPFPCSKTLFRTVTSADGYPDVIGAPTQLFDVIFGPELGVYVNPKSDSDDGAASVHTGESIIYNFNVVNTIGDADGNNVVLTVPIPPHTTYLNSTLVNGIAAQQIKDKSGKTTAVSWTFPTIAKGAQLTTPSVTVQVDSAGMFSSKEQKKYPQGAGYIIIEQNIALSAIAQGMKAAPVIYNGTHAFGKDECDTEIVGSLKFDAVGSNKDETHPANPGDLITYNFDCENDDAQPLTGATVTSAIPNGTELVTVYSFDSYNPVTGDANAQNQPLQNPGPLTNPAIIYKRTSFNAVISPAVFGLPLDPKNLNATQKQEYTLLFNIWKAKPGTELDPGTTTDVTTLAQLDSAAFQILLEDGFITPARIVWTLGSIGPSPAPRSVEVSFTVRVPYDGGHVDQIVNNDYDFGVLDPTASAKLKKFVFSQSALYGADPKSLVAPVNRNVEPATQPHLKINKTARGPFQLANANFHGAGTALYPGIGDVVIAVAGHGVDYELDYSNLDYVTTTSTTAAADAHGVVLHDVIPLGMQLAGFFKQHIGPAQKSGQLVAGTRYTIAEYVDGDNFTNVGAPSNETGASFVATGTTPTTWSNGSSLYAEAEMHAEQFTFYDKSGVIIPGINPDGSANMANVASMDIRLGDIANLTNVPRNSAGYITYTCVPTIGPSDQIKYSPKGEPEGFFGGPGLIHSFGGFNNLDDISGPLQGFYISTSDAPDSPAQGTPDDLVVKVKNDISFTFFNGGPQKGLLIRGPLAGHDQRAQPGDVQVYDFTFTQNGDLAANGSVLLFDLPPGVTLLNEQVSGNTASGNKPAPNGDFHAVIIDESGTSAANLAQSGTTAQITLGKVDGHTTRTARIFLLVNNPVDPALMAGGRFETGFFPLNSHITFQFGSTHAHSGLFTRASSPVLSGTSGATSIDQTPVAPLGAPQLSIHRDVSKAVVPKGSQFTYTLSFANSGDSDATNVKVGMQIPWGAQFVSTGNGTLSVLQSGSSVVIPNSKSPTMTPRNADQVNGTGPGPDIITWHFDTLPAHSTGRIDLLVQCFNGSKKAAAFADNLIQDNSVYIHADNAATAFLSPNQIGVWVKGSSFDKKKPEMVHKFLDNFGIHAADSDKVAADAANDLINTLSEDSHIKADAALDYLSVMNPASAVHVYPLGQNQVMIVASGAGNIVASGAGNLTVPLPGNQSMIVASGAGNIISHDGGTIVASGAGNIVASGAGNIVASGAGNIVASGAGNAISLTNVAGIGGTHDCAYLLDHSLDIVAAGGGNIVAAGAGNLISSDGLGNSNLISNQAGGGIIAPITPGEIASGLVNTNGSNLVIKGAGVISGIGDISSMVAHSAANNITLEGRDIAVAGSGADLANIKGGAIVASGAGNIVASGAGNIVASGAGNIVASGAGNIVASGAGN